LTPVSIRFPLFFNQTGPLFWGVLLKITNFSEPGPEKMGILGENP
jgi:hypothetical protein